MSPTPYSPSTRGCRLIGARLHPHVEAATRLYCYEWSATAPMLDTSAVMGPGLAPFGAPRDDVGAMLQRIGAIILALSDTESSLPCGGG